MKLHRLLAPLAAAVALLGATHSAQAALVLQVSSGGTTYTIADGSAFDTDTSAGGVIFNGSVGAWELALASGTGDLNPFLLHLSSVVRGTAGDGPLTIKLTQTDLVANSSIVTLFGDGGGSGVAGSGASWSAWVDDSNAAFGQGTLIESSSGYGSSFDTVNAGLSGTYSATLVTTFDYTNMTLSNRRQSSLDVQMGVPEPASLALVGIGLLGAGFARRRKTQA